MQTTTPVPAPVPAPTPELLPTPAAAPRLRAAGTAWALAAAGLGLLLAWRLADVLLLGFAGVLLALLLRLLSAPLHHRLGLQPRWALVLVIAGIALLVGAGSWVAGADVIAQLQALRETVPRAMEALRHWLAEYAPGRWLLDLWQSSTLTPEDWSRLAGVATGTAHATVAALGSLVLLAALGVYIAADPETYRRGFLRLIPLAARPRAERVLHAVAHNLSRWLLGQALSMLAVGVLTGVGLALIGLPLAMSLGVVAGVLEFVPYFGPIVSGFFIVAVALAEGETQALWAALICVLVQQAEALLVQPLAQRWAVRLPPALGMLSVLIFGILFGLAGVLLAVPLMVLTMTLVEHLYVRAWVEPDEAVRWHDTARPAAGLEPPL